MPYLISKFKGNKWSKNSHIETILPALFRKIELKYDRERLELADGDFLDLDFIKTGNERILILFHGLEGSSKSQYIKGFAKYFNNKGFDICAMNFRSCSDENNRLIESYHMGRSDDASLIVNHVINNNNYSEVVLGGFSLGGNVLLKYLGEQGANLNEKIKCAFAFSVPVDLSKSSKTLAKNWNKPFMIKFLRTLNKKIIAKAKQFPNKIDITRINKIDNFTEWDNRFTSKIHGFKNAEDYYAKCNSLQFISAIKLRTLLVNSVNDPFLSKTCYPKGIAKKSASFYLEVPDFGGHVGYSLKSINGDYYSEVRAFEFVSAMLQNKEFE